jgi:general transcription factor 3C polypeptide 3 (transcription factor C subunit 4)
MECFKRYAPTGQAKSTDPDDGGGDDDGEENVERGGVVEIELHDKFKRPEIPTKENAVIVTIYGQICIAAKSYQSAICASIFLILHAYDYCPEEWFVYVLR